MDLSDGPAALGGIMMCVALGAWTLGRWQGGLAVPDDGAGRVPGDAAHAAPVLRKALAERPAKPCQQDALAARRAVLAVADSLVELHAEVSAYRRAEQVLSGARPDELVMWHRCDDTGRACRHIGLTGEPICDLSETARRACKAGATALRAGSRCGGQPSPASLDPLRV
jgi:hypothetical protein